ncbi:MAG TPA: sigma-70 family RNA polymerase sigma factor [Gaiellaceae bacterium]|nr:sigma-70 family RNA polymerase sigma factor [Gaiellaceae bacterium]
MTIDFAQQPVSDSSGARGAEERSSAGLEDSLQLYFRGVGRVPVLSRAEERELFRRKEAGDESARRLLIEANLRLVIWVVRQYARHDVPLLDLIQEGNLALTRAVEKFDYRMGYRLATYATPSIRHAVEQAAERNARVPVPLNVRRQIRAVRRSQQALRQRLNREPRLGEIAVETGFAVSRVAELLDYAQEPVSFEWPADETARARADLDDTEWAQPEAKLADRLRREEVESILEALDDRLRLVLDRRFGLSGQPPQSLVEVGRALGVTRERVRQLEVMALDQLRSLAPDLRDYLEVA